MKKLILIVFTIFLTTNSFSQGIDIGIKAGANFANLTDIDDTSMRTGLLVGAFVTLKFSDKLALQGDVLFSQQGAEVNLGDIDLDYINMPIVLKYYIVKRLNIQAGPQFGFLTKDHLSSESYDVSGVVGVGVDLPLGFRVDGRYNFGLTKIFPTTESSVKNSVVSIAVGFSFI